MNKQSDYAEIGWYDSPDGYDDSLFDTLRNIYRWVPNLEERLDGNVIKIESYKKSFWGKVTKVLDVSIQKIIDADEATKSFHETSNGKVFGIIIIQDDKEIYRALYDTGILGACLNIHKEIWDEKFIECSITTWNLEMQQIIKPSRDVIYALIKLNEKIEKLFD